jgi:hypothetical protein
MVLLKHTEMKTTVKGCMCFWLLCLCHPASQKISLYLKYWVSTGQSTEARCMLPAAQSIWTPLTAAFHAVCSSETLHPSQPHMIISRQLHSYFKLFSMTYGISVYLGYDRKNCNTHGDRYPTKVDGIGHQLYTHISRCIDRASYHNWGCILPTYAQY